MFSVTYNGEGFFITPSHTSQNNLLPDEKIIFISVL